MDFEQRAATLERLLAERAWVRRLAGVLVQDAALSDDLVQDVYVAALERAPASVTNPRAWLGTVLRNLARNRYRADARRVRREHRHVPQEAPSSPPDVVAHAEEMERVARLALALDEPYRTTLLLRFVEDLSPRAVAHRLGVPVETIRSRLRRGLARLRMLLDEEHQGKRRSWVLLVGPWATPPSSTSVAGALAGGILVKKTLVTLLILAAVVAIWAWRDRGGHRVARTESPSIEALEGAAATLEGRAPRKKDAGATVTRGASDGPQEASTAATYDGRVVDARGRGVADAVVALWWWAAEPPRASDGHGPHLVIRRERERQALPQTHTDGNGVFHFRRPYPGRVWLRATASGFAPALAGPAVAGSTTPIVLPREAELLVHVFDPEGEPVEGAEVRLAPASPPVTPGRMRIRHVLVLARTDANGVARLPCAPSGDLQLEVDPRAPGFGFVEQPLAAHEHEVRVTLSAVRVVERRIVDAVTGRPIADAYVNVLASSRGARSPWPDLLRRRFLANEDGVVRFPHQEGYYAEYATAPGYEVIDAWEDPIRLPRAMRIQGTVCTADGAPVVGAALLVAGDGGSLSCIRVGEPGVGAWSDEQGRFALEVKLPHGLRNTSRAKGRVVSLVALHPDHPPAIEDRIPAPPGGHAVVDLVVPEPTTLTVEVVDAMGTPCVDEWLGVNREVPRADGGEAPAHPLEGRHFDPLHLQRGGSYVTGADGRCVIKGLCPGRWIVSTNMLNEWTNVVLGAGEERNVRIEKRGAWAVTGRVLNADGTPFQGQVVLRGSRLDIGRTDEAGEFGFKDLEPGSATIAIHTVQAGTRMTYERPVHAGEHVEIRIPLAARLHLDVEGPPAPAIEYALMTTAGGRDPQAPGFSTLDPASGLTNPFTPGPGLLLVRARGFGWTSVRFDASPGRTTDVRVSMRRAGTVRVHVANAHASSGWHVRLTRVDGLTAARAGEDERLTGLIDRARGGRSESITPDAQGRFESTDIPPATYDASYGHWLHETRTWVGGPPVRVEVRSGEASEIDLSGP